MTQLSSIHHEGFSRLHELTNNYNKATLLDKCLYWWQISTYTLEDGHIWFTRSLDQIAIDAKLAKRTVERYLCDFEQQGFIEKTNRLFKKKHLYIRATHKLLSLLGMEISQSPLEKSSITDNCSFSNHDGGFDSANLAVSIYKEKDNNILVTNNTVSDVSSVNNLSSKPSNIETLYPKYVIEEHIQDILCSRDINCIKGMMRNLQKQHNIQLSSPEQVFAEIVFTLTNNTQLKGIEGFQHRLNIVSKILREKRWKTPKGFFNHAFYAKAFKENIDNRDKQNHVIVQENADIKALEQKSDTLYHAFTEDFNYLKECLFYNKEGVSEALKQSLYRKLQQHTKNHLTLFNTLDYQSLVFDIPVIGSTDYENIITLLDKTETHMAALLRFHTYIEEDINKTKTLIPEEEEFINLCLEHQQVLIAHHTLLQSKLNRLNEALYEPIAA